MQTSCACLQDKEAWLHKKALSYKKSTGCPTEGPKQTSAFVWSLKGAKMLWSHKTALRLHRRGPHLSPPMRALCKPTSQLPCHPDEPRLMHNAPL